MLFYGQRIHPHIHLTFTFHGPYIQLHFSVFSMTIESILHIHVHIHVHVYVHVYWTFTFHVFLYIANYTCITYMYS